MRTFSLLASAAAFVLVLGIEPGDALDGKPSSPQTPTLAMSPVDAMRNATEALKTGEKNRDRKVSAALRAYAAMATSADKGAVRDVSKLG
jgi:dihydroxy-acid dehydratase